MTWRPLRGLGVSPPENFSFQQYYSDVCKYAPPRKRAGRAYNRVKDGICKLKKIGPYEEGEPNDDDDEEVNIEQEDAEDDARDESREVIGPSETNGGSLVDDGDSIPKASVAANLSSKIPAVYAEEARIQLAAGNKKRAKVTIASNWGFATWKQKSCRAQRLLLLHDSGYDITPFLANGSKANEEIEAIFKQQEALNTSSQTTEATEVMTHDDGEQTTMGVHIAENNAKVMQHTYKDQGIDLHVSSGESAGKSITYQHKTDEKMPQPELGHTYSSAKSKANTHRAKPQTRSQKRSADEVGLEDVGGRDKRREISQGGNESGTEAHHKTGGKRLPRKR